MKNLLIVLFFFLLSFIPIYEFLGGIIAGGENFLYINPNYVNYSTSWEDKFNFGQRSANQSNFVLFTVFWRVLEAIPYVHPSVTFIFLSFFLSSLTFYLLCAHLFKFKNKFYYVPAALLYSFNTFRMTGPLNERQSLLFISLPLFILIYWKFCEKLKWIHVVLLGIISVIFSSMGGNLPVFLIPYLLIFLMFLFYFGVYTRFKKEKLVNFILKNAVLALLLLILNSFWLVPLYFGLIKQTESILSFSNYFVVTASGYFLDHLRFIGSWAWRNGHAGSPYYPFYKALDTPMLLITTFGVSLIALLGIFFLKDSKNKDQRNLLSFIAILTPISFLLLAGGKGPLGFIFNYLHNEVLIFQVFREPFAKFTPLFIISICIFLVYSLWHLGSRLKVQWQIILLAGFTAIVLLNAFPFFNGQAMPIKKWIGGRGGNLIKIPEYWSEAKRFLENDLSDRRITLFPYMPYGGGHLWPYAVGTVGNMADYLLRNQIIKAWEIDNGLAGNTIKDIISEMNPKNLSKTIGFLNSKYVLQMNDFDWRFSLKTLDPLKSNQILIDSGFELITSFGKLDEILINQINSEDKNPVPIANLNIILNKPALNIYKVPQRYYFPHLYLADQSIISQEGTASLSAIIEKMDSNSRPQIIFKSQNGNKSTDLLCLEDCVKDETVLEYKKVSSTKYVAIVHNPGETKQSLVFTESYDPGWELSVNCIDQPKMSEIESTSDYQIFLGNEEDQASPDEIKTYIEREWISNLGGKAKKTYPRYQIKNNKETIVSRDFYDVAFITKINKGTIQNDNLNEKSFVGENQPIGESSHFIANGFANSWVLDPKSHCTANKDISITIEFVPQQKQNLLWIISGVATSLLILTSIIWMFKKYKNE